MRASVLHMFHGYNTAMLFPQYILPPAAQARLFTSIASLW
jgi:hypothetical protein